jgi:2-oxoglutarate ferredoxin oxidoreductase subunit gamma
MTKTHEVRIAGFGGQGVILAGFIIGKAASLYDQKAATMTQNYGPESRGGACMADVLISEEEIGYPKVKHPDILVALSQEAYAVNVAKVAEGGLVIADSDLVKFDRQPDAQVRMVPATRLAEELGKKLVANIIMLGFFTAQTGLVSPEAMRRAIQSSVPARFTALNLKAFEVGFEYGRN